MEGAPAYSPIRVGVSDKQRARLRNGHRVRVSPPVEGSGVQLIIDPSKLNNISKCFRAGKGTTIQLSPSEIAANRTVEGEGIFGKKFDRFVKKTIGKKATKQLYDVAEKVGKPLVNKGLDALATAATIYAPGAAPAIEAAKKAAKGYIARPTAYQEDPVGELVKDVNPAKMAEDYAKGKIDEYMRGEGVFDTVKKLAKSKTGKMLQKKAIGFAKKEAMKAGLPSEVANVLAGAAEKGVEGQGLYASSRGRGVMGRGAMIGAGYLPPALQSQANSANFHFSTQLPPAYASIIKGNGLYA
jgi:hypothetical protein